MVPAGLEFLVFVSVLVEVAQRDLGAFEVEDGKPEQLPLSWPSCTSHSANRQLTVEGVVSSLRRTGTPQCPIHVLKSSGNPSGRGLYAQHMCS